MATPLPPKDEEAFLQQIKALALLTGWRFFHVRDSRGSDAGYPDCTLLKPPRLVFVELKLAGKQRTEAQVAWALDLVQCDGVQYFLWTTDDWPQIAAFFGVEVTT